MLPDMPAHFGEEVPGVCTIAKSGLRSGSAKKDKSRSAAYG